MIALESAAAVPNNAPIVTTRVCLLVRKARREIGSARRFDVRRKTPTDISTAGGKPFKNAEKKREA
jgi:hypothetical protein